MTYSALSEHFRRIGQLREVGAIVEWDRAVNMPDAAAPARAAALSGLDVTIHQMVSEPRVGEWLAGANTETLEPWQRRNLTLMRRQHVRATAVPSELVSEATEASLNCEQGWRRYRQENDFAGFLPSFERVVKARQAVGAALGEALDVTPYAALMGSFEAGLSTDMIDSAFAQLKAFLPDFTERVIERQRSAGVIEPQGPFDVSAQKALGQRLMVAMGFDDSRGRLDTSHHPFCGGAPADVRITTRYDEADYSKALMGVLHETGHAKYEQGLPSEWSHQPIGEAAGMVLHESQSLLLEMQVCRSQEFAAFATSHIRDAFPEAARAQSSTFAVENLVRLATRVERSFIRVDADEVTYPAHVMLRYELERQLIAGTLLPRDLPEAWNAEMEALLGLSTRGNDRDGCLQDVHWPAGLFGYFPLYTLGAMAAAQLFQAVERAVPDVRQDIATGDVSALDTWLRDNVWRKASSADTNDILQAATGQPLSAEPFIAHLERRYLP